MKIMAQVSAGELLDKLTILEIKASRISDAGKLKSINHELDVVSKTWQAAKPSDIDISSEIAELKKINQTLWDIEDDIRAKEANKQFDNEFIELARAVYITNDQRAAIKHKLNIKLGSDIVEEKSYEQY